MPTNPILPPYTIECNEGTAIGIVFAHNAWYRWCNALGAYALCDEKLAASAVMAVVNALNALPFAIEISAGINAGEGDGTRH